MAYFTAVLSPEGSGDDRAWRSVDIDLEAGSPDELGDALRGAVDDDDVPVLAVLEREDEWFALVRADAGGEVRSFVSDLLAAGSGPYAGLFSEDVLDPGLPVHRAQDDGGSDDDEDDEDESGGAPPGAPAPDDEEPSWAGDPAVLADLGCPAEELLALTARGDDPAAALAEVGELLGCAEVMESLR